jgi:hypothetical protein
MPFVHVADVDRSVGSCERLGFVMEKQSRRTAGGSGRSASAATAEPVDSRTQAV